MKTLGSRLSALIGRAMVGFFIISGILVATISVPSLRGYYEATLVYWLAAFGGICVKAGIQNIKANGKGSGNGA